MYLPEEKRALIRSCIETTSQTKCVSQKTGSDSKRPKKNCASYRKVAQILFEARSGNEVFTPF
jgi:hypothetical protein